MAIQLINKDPNILTNYELVMLHSDTQCRSDVAMKQFMFYLSNSTHPIAGIVGRYT